MSIDRNIEIRDFLKEAEEILAPFKSRIGRTLYFEIRDAIISENTGNESAHKGAQPRSPNVPRETQWVYCFLDYYTYRACNGCPSTGCTGEGKYPVGFKEWIRAMEARFDALEAAARAPLAA